jgi:hypothetical protein
MKSRRWMIVLCALTLCACAREFATLPLVSTKPFGSSYAPVAAKLRAEECNWTVAVSGIVLPSEPKPDPVRVRHAVGSILQQAPGGDLLINASIQSVARVYPLLVIVVVGDCLRIEGDVVDSRTPLDSRGLANP